MILEGAVLRVAVLRQRVWIAAAFAYQGRCASDTITKSLRDPPRRQRIEGSGRVANGYETPGRIMVEHLRSRIEHLHTTWPLAIARESPNEATGEQLLTPEPTSFPRVSLHD